MNNWDCGLKIGSALILNHSTFRKAAWSKKLVKNDSF